MVAKDSELHSPEARQIFADAISCLEHIIQAGKVEPGLDSREQAMAEKATLIRRFGGRMAVQGGG